MKTLGTFVITVALIIGLVGCAPAPTQYNLTVSTTEGGEITTPGDGAFAYDEGTVVPLEAFPHTGTITVNGNYEITANFEETPTITFAIAGPMTDIQGKNQWWGAELARDEINAGPGLNVGGVYHRVGLVQVDTNEFAGIPEEGVTALQAVIDDVHFVLGSLTPENVVVYREVAMDAQKIFMNCGAARGSLQYSVVEDYDRYKYWFKSTPYNETFFGDQPFQDNKNNWSGLESDAGRVWRCRG
jgi:hypothetical protein